MCKIPIQRFNAGRPEDYPPHRDEGEGEEDLAGLPDGRKEAVLGDGIGLEALALAEEDEEAEEQAVVGAPGDEGPVGAVPEAGDEEDDEGVAEDLPPGAAAAAEGDVDVVAEPGGEGDVPSAPELGDVAAEVRAGEVLPEADAEELRRADGHVGVAGEVGVDLEGVEDGSKQERAAGLRLNIGPDLVNVLGAAVGDDDFLEEAPEELSQAVCGCGVVECARFCVLWEEVGGASDGAGEELGEEADKGGVRYEVTGRLDLLLVDVDGVAEGGEGVEAYADGEDDLYEEAVVCEGGDEGCEGGDEEVVVLEDEEREEGENYREDKAGLCAALRDEEAAGVGDEGDEGDEAEEAPVPECVEGVGGCDEADVLELYLRPLCGAGALFICREWGLRLGDSLPVALSPATEDKPVEDEHYRQEGCKFY